MLLNELCGKVTKQKYEKYLKKVEENEEFYTSLESLDMEDETKVNEYVKKVFGEPTGLWTNTPETQVKLLRRINGDMNKNKQNTNMMRPDWSEADINS